MPFIKSIKLSGLLSFPPDTPALELTPLNVLIGPNGSGKSNFLEAFELLHAAPTALAAFLREGGTAQEWLCNGKPTAEEADIDVIVQRQKRLPDLRYYLKFAPSGLRTEILDEAIEEPEKRSPSDKDVFFYYRFQRGRPVLNARQAQGPGYFDVNPRPRDGQGKMQVKKPKYAHRYLERESLAPDESILSQRKDSDLYPEMNWLGQQFGRIQSFRDWTFGRSAPLRRPQQGDLPSDALLADSDNLALVLNELQHTDASIEFNRLLSRFLPRFQRFSTRIQGGSFQFYLHEDGLKSPVPATRLSDGTIRFMAILALLLSPTPPPLICMEEPELGLHPDAVVLLADILVEASSRTQLIITTHSDAMVSALTDHADSVVVCENLGGTVLRRVEAEKFQHLLEKYRLGELWSMGELGGNP